MKRLQTTILVVFSFCDVLLAQQVVTGKVADARSNQKLIGVNVIIAGTSRGTITDIEGNYKLEVPEEASLKFSLIGYIELEIPIGNRSVLDVRMVEETMKLDEVVVTALGLTREMMALGYSVGEVDGDVMTGAREINFTNQLTGRVPGVNVSKLATGPAGSTRVVIRGNASLRGDNQPLYVIDGVPMDNTNFGQAGMWGGADDGDGTTSINPDDIESINVLKGGAAANLYGSRAANGVIVINTRKGVKRQGLGVEFNSNYVQESICDLTEFQTDYGHGTQGRKPNRTDEAYRYSNQAWGPKIDGSQALVFDGSEEPYINYAADGNNIEEFLRTGSTFSNSLAVTGGGDVQTFRASAAYLMNESVVPNAGFDRFNLGINTAGTYGIFEVSTQMLYSNENVRGRPNVSDSPGNIFASIYSMPATIDQSWFRGDPNKPGASWEEQQNQNPDLQNLIPGEELSFGHPYLQNPYWAAYQNERDESRDRLVGYLTGKINFTDHLWLRGRLGMDWQTKRYRGVIPYGTEYARKGYVRESEYRIRETNFEWMAGYENTWGNFGLNAFIGGNAMRRDWEMLQLDATALVLPFIHTIANGGYQTNTHEITREGINSLFGSIEMNYGGYLFLTATGRQDWFSTLNPETNHIFYPSVSLSYVFSEMAPLPSWLSYGQVRASWAQVGGDIDPYKTDVPYIIRGEGHVGRPMAGVLQTFVPNPILRPMRRDDWEIGAALRFLDNRLGFDVAYYHAITSDEIIDAAISEASGFEATVLNSGKLESRGIEVLFTTTPVHSAFTWDLSVNFALNNNKVLSLNDRDSLDRLLISDYGEARTGNAFIQHIIGQPFSSILGYTYKEINGEKVYNESGYPVYKDSLSVLGNGVHKYTGGINNRFEWKNFYLEFLVDFKIGGNIYSRTNSGLTSLGQHKITLEGRESGLPVSGVDREGQPLEMVVPREELQDYWREYSKITEYFVYDASFWKLRQVVLGYTFPEKLLGKMPFNYLNLSFVARNLWLIKSYMENVDPESTYNNTNAQGLESFGFPSTRTYGFNLRVRF